MTEDRRKEIALLIVEQRIFEEGIPAGKSSLRQNAGNLAQKIGQEVTTDELMEFYQSFIPKLYGRIFGYETVSIHATNPRKVYQER